MSDPDPAARDAFARLLASEIRAEMGRQGLSVRALARRADMDHVKLNNRLRKEPRSGKPIPLGALDLYDLCEALGISVGELVDRVAAMAQDEAHG